MEIKSHNHTSNFQEGKLYFRGIVNLNYQNIVKLFGLPIDGDLYRSDVKWKLHIVLNDGAELFGELYNYKNGQSFLGDEAFKLNDIPYWHISTDKTFATIKLTSMLETYIKENISNSKNKINSYG